MNMAVDPKPVSFEAFVHWLAGADNAKQLDSAKPSEEIVAAAREARREFQAVIGTQKQAILEKVRSGRFFEDFQVMAAADSRPDRRMPRLRTPNGFAITPLYANTYSAGAAPAGVLVECPADLLDVFQGQRAHVLVAGQWVDIGEIDLAGRAAADLPFGLEFKPPFGFRVGNLEEDPQKIEDSEGPK
jgi:hypothetical protein